MVASFKLLDQVSPKVSLLSDLSIMQANTSAL